MLGLTTIGGVAAAVATPNGIAAPSQTAAGFGPGAGRGGFGGGQLGPGQNPQQAPQGRAGRPGRGVR